jgi:two-component system alkaline phosphatase synthesis response regulator PhoP
MRILIVEDRMDLAELIKHHLEKSGFLPSFAPDGKEALRLLQSEKFDLILLDLMLPKISGIEILKWIKANDKIKSTPVIIESAKNDDEDVILGLELGADDYITKPFSPKVLIARIKKVLERQTKHLSGIITVNQGEILVNLENHDVSVIGQKVQLTIAEFGILVCLLQNQNRIMSRETILKEVWQNKSIVVDRVIDVHITSLRKKLGPVSRYLHTVRGVGYIFTTGPE